MARQFFGRDLGAHRAAGFAHDPRWQTTGALKRLFSRDLRDALAGRDAVAELLADAAAPSSRSWTPLAQDQYLEMRTLLAGYLLSSQGDRMLMAHSVEGRFPFLDSDVVALAELAARRATSCACSTRSTCSSAPRAALVPAEILRAQEAALPRARRAVVRRRRRARPRSTSCCRERALREAGVFEPAAVAQLLRQVPRAATDGAVLERRQHGAGRRPVDPAPPPPADRATVRRDRLRPTLDTLAAPTVETCTPH